jgi:hypothetical protein
VAVLVRVRRGCLGEGIRELEGVKRRQHLGDNYMPQRSRPVGGEYHDRRLPGADRAICYDLEDVKISVRFSFDDRSKQSVKPV